MRIYAPLSKEELALDYAKYYALPVEFPSAEEEERLRIPMKPENAIPAENLAQAFTTEGNPGTENRYCILPDGSAYADMAVELPDCTGEMLGWWFQWFITPPAGVPAEQGNLRYKIWNPLDHWDTRNGIVVESFDDGGGDPRWHTTHNSLQPEEFGLPAEQAEALRSQGVFFACSVNQTPGMADRIGMSLHQPLPGGGILTRAKYWFGWTISDGAPTRDLNGQQYTADMVRKILRHNIIEKRKLNSLLPALYPEQAHKPLQTD